MQHSLPQRRVLIVDRNVHAAETLGCWLEIASYRVLTAYDGFAAIAQARSFAPDAVILDITLPGLNGFEVAAALRSLPEGHRTLVIAHTSYHEDDYRQRAAEAGIDHYVAKPGQPSHLRQLLASHPSTPASGVHQAEALHALDYA